MANLFWLSEAEWAAIRPHLPMKHTGPERVDDRRVLSGIIHVLRSGCRWRDCPAEYGPPTTVYNRFNRWSGRGLWAQLLEVLATVEGSQALMADSSLVKAHRSAAGAKGGSRRRQSAVRGVAAQPRSTRSPMSRADRARSSSRADKPTTFRSR
jgi:transposase